LSPAVAPYLAVSVAAALIYGLLLQFRPSGALRTGVKTAAVGALALLAVRTDAPLLLTAALALSAVGDAFLAGDPKRWLPAGLSAFLAAHVLYVAFFLEIGGVAALASPSWRWLGGSGALVLGLALVMYLWKHLGPLRPAVIAYALAISAMVGAAFSLPAAHSSAVFGAVGFMLSDGVLSFRLFRWAERPAVLADHLVWWLYFGGQLAIAAAFLT